VIETARREPDEARVVPAVQIGELLFVSR